MRIKPTTQRRNVTIDIETVPLSSADHDGALSALTGRIVCIAMLIDDGRTVEDVALIDPDERSILTQFWEALRRTDLLIGYNILNFDLPFIRQRSWISSVKPSRRIDLRRYYTQDVLDLMQTWSV